MKVCGICGPSGVGKTTLIEGLIAELRRAGQRVSVVKHMRRDFEIDVPGKDSHRHREAGAFEVVTASPWRVVKQRQFEVEVDVKVHQLLAELVEVDWALVEGFRHADLLRIEMWQPGQADAPVYPDDPFVVALATDAPDALPVATLRPVFARSDAAAVAAFLMNSGERFEYEFHG